MSKIERRTFPIHDWSERAAAGKLKQWRGYAAVFNVETQIGTFREKILPGAFKTAIAQDDVRALIDHIPHLILGRNRAYPTPTLRLKEDSIGLAIEIDPPDTTYAHDLAESIARGDVSQMSFAFSIPEGGGESWDFSNRDNPLRTISKVRLFDVSPVSFPAYPTTDISEANSYKERVRKQSEWRKRKLALMEVQCKSADVWVNLARGRNGRMAQLHKALVR